MPPQPLAPDSQPLSRARVQVAILEDLTRTGICIADNLHRVGEPTSPQQWGGVFSDPVVRPLVRHTGYIRSTRRERHGGPVGMWILRPEMGQEASNRLEASRTVLDHLEALYGDGDTLSLEQAA